MKNKTNILFFTIIVLILSGCRKENAGEFNDKLVEYKNRADSDFISMNKYINMAIVEKEYNTIDYITRSAADSLTARIDAIKSMNIPESGNRFKDATIHYVHSLIHVSERYKSYILLADSTVSPMQVDSLLSEIKKTESTIDSALQSLADAQRDFARVNHLKLEPNSRDK